MSRKDERRTEKRARIVEKLAHHFLEAGLGETGLRRLAEVAGTSDRMLLYYFENKDEIVTAVLREIAAGLADDLREVFEKTPVAPARALSRLWETLKGDAYANQLRLWLDLSSQASRGDPVSGAIVTEIGEGWIAWASAILDVPKKDKAALAVLIMAAVDGQIVLFPTDLARGDAAIGQLVKMLARR